MSVAVDTFLYQLKDSKKEIALVRKGLKPPVVEAVLKQEGIVLKDVLERLDIPASTYFARKKSRKPLDSHSTEKIIRLMHIMDTAREVMGREQALKWLYAPVPSLGNEVPIDLLDTDAGARLVEQVLLRIQYGVYG